MNGNLGFPSLVSAYRISESARTSPISGRSKFLLTHRSGATLE